MSKHDNFENEILLHIFNNVAISDIGDVTGLPAGTAGDLFVGLHTADVTDSGANQSTSETAYTGYAREAVVRSGAGWTVTGDSVSPTANIDFGECTAAPGGDLTHFTVGKELSGTTDILYIGTLSPNIVMATGVIPRVKTTSTITED